MNIDINALITQILKDRKKMILAAAIGFSVLYLDFSFVLKPQWQAVSKLNSEIVKVKNDLKNLKTDLVRMQRSLDNSLASKTKRIISLDQKSLLIEEIYKLGNQYELKINQVNTAKDVTSKAGSHTATVSTLSLVLDIDAAYYPFVNFLNALENHSIFMAIEELGIGHSEKDILSHRIRLVINTYVKN